MIPVWFIIFPLQDLLSQDRINHLWGPLRNENAGLLVQKLRIAKAWQQSHKPHTGSRVAVRLIHHKASLVPNTLVMIYVEYMLISESINSITRARIRGEEEREGTPASSKQPTFISFVLLLGTLIRMGSTVEVWETQLCSTIVEFGVHCHS